MDLPMDEMGNINQDKLLEMATKLAGQKMSQNNEVSEEQVQGVYSLDFFINLQSYYIF